MRLLNQFICLCPSSLLHTLFWVQENINNIIISVEFIVKFIIEIIDYKAVEETNIDSRRKSKRSLNKNSKYYNKDFISNDNDNVIDETNISI